MPPGRSRRFRRPELTECPRTMLPRTLEPEAMDTPEEALEYDRMDHAAVNHAFAQDFLAAHGPSRGGLILDVGTGTARIPIAIAHLDSTAQIQATDLSKPMLEIAERNVSSAGLSGRVSVRMVDAKGFVDDSAGSFEAVISNSIIHHIPEPRVVMAEMVRLVAPGGTLFCRDLARPDSRAEVGRLVREYAGSASGEAQFLLEASLHAALTLDEIRAIVASLGLPPERVTRTSDRHWTWSWKAT